MIENGADINTTNKEGQTPLLAACEQGNIEIATLLMKNGAQINATNKGERPLLNLACAKGNIEIVTLLIENGADINKVDVDGRSPLILACRNGITEVAKLLIKQGAEFQQVNREGETPLLAACEQGNIEIATLLIKNGAQINATNKGGRPLLNLACAKGNIEIVTLLIENGADLNTTNKEGLTPLLAACYNGNREVAALLIEKGAAIDKTNKLGETALDIAIKKKDKDIVTNLLKKGGQINNNIYYLAKKTQDKEIMNLIGEALFEKEGNELSKAFYKLDKQAIINAMAQKDVAWQPTILEFLCTVKTHQPDVLKVFFSDFLDFPQSNPSTIDWLKSFVSDVPQSNSRIINQAMTLEKVGELIVKFDLKALTNKLRQEGKNPIEVFFQKGFSCSQIKYILSTQPAGQVREWRSQFFIKYPHRIKDCIDGLATVNTKYWSRPETRDVVPKAPQGVGIELYQTYIDQLQSNDPNAFGYIPPGEIVSFVENAYTYIDRIKNRTPFLGTPQKGSTALEDFYSSIENLLKHVLIALLDTTWQSVLLHDRLYIIFLCRGHQSLSFTYYICPRSPIQKKIKGKYSMF